MRNETANPKPSLAEFGIFKHDTLKYPKLVHSNCLQSVITYSRMFKFMTLDDDAISHYHLRIFNITKRNLRPLPVTTTVFI